MTQNVMTNDSMSEENRLLDRPLNSLMKFNWENIAWIALMIIAAVAPAISRIDPQPNQRKAPAARTSGRRQRV